MNTAAATMIERIKELLDDYPRQPFDGCTEDWTAWKTSGVFLGNAIRQLEKIV